MCDTTTCNVLAAIMYPIYRVMRALLDVGEFDFDSSARLHQQVSAVIIRVIPFCSCLPCLYKGEKKPEPEPNNLADREAPILLDTGAAAASPLASADLVVPEQETMSLAPELHTEEAPDTKAVLGWAKIGRTLGMHGNRPDDDGPSRVYANAHDEIGLNGGGSKPENRSMVERLVEARDLPHGQAKSLPPVIYESTVVGGPKILYAPLQSVASTEGDIDLWVSRAEFVFVKGRKDSMDTRHLHAGGSMGRSGPSAAGPEASIQQSPILEHDETANSLWHSTFDDDTLCRYATQGTILDEYGHGSLGDADQSSEYVAKKFTV